MPSTSGCLQRPKPPMLGSRRRVGRPRLDLALYFPSRGARPLGEVALYSIQRLGHAPVKMHRNNAPGFLPVTPSETYIVAVMVGDLDKRKKLSDLLLAEHGIFVRIRPPRAAPEGGASRRGLITTTH